MLQNFRFLAISLLFVLMLSCGSKTEQNGNEQPQKNITKKLEEQQQVKISKVKVIKTIPHDKAAFTQGLVFYGAKLFESTGLKGESSLRRLDPETGDVIKKVEISQEYFAEGITVFNKKIYQLTWVSHKCFVYDAETFKKTGEYTYYGEGWGITNDKEHLFMSDGSNVIRILDPANFEIIKNLTVLDNDMNPIQNLNELEYINGEIWANIWQTDNIVRIDPVTGKAKGWIDLSVLRSYLKPQDKVDVINGIAYDAKRDVILVTGKYWPLMFEIKIEE